jgi:glutathione synthase/RimK-type ligase-like ATP-grasp enzyme
MNKKVLLVTYEGDSPTLLSDMAEALRARGARSLRFDTDRFPMQPWASFRQDGGGESFVFSDGSERIELGPGDAIWYRRSRFGGLLPPAMDPQIRRAAQGECEDLVRGMLAAAPCFVLDQPDRVRRCGNKPWQQRTAREVGLPTPRTLMTSNPEEAREFLASCPHGAIAKMLSAFAIYDERNQERVVFTTALRPEHTEKLAGLRYCPMVFQERIPKRLELRITAIGRRLFAAAVDSGAMPGAEVDWREKGLALVRSWVPYSLPADVEAALHRYMDRIGMQYSAIDVLVEPGGRHVFLEANPAGEFYWMQACAPHFPLVESLADVLTDQPGARRLPSAEAPGALPIPPAPAAASWLPTAASL